MGGAIWPKLVKARGLTRYVIYPACLSGRSYLAETSEGERSDTLRYLPRLFRQVGGAIWLKLKKARVLTLRYLPRLSKCAELSE